MQKQLIIAATLAAILVTSACADVREFADRHPTATKVAIGVLVTSAALTIVEASHGEHAYVGPKCPPLCRVGGVD
jgi:hypothetical protein